MITAEGLKEYTLEKQNISAISWRSVLLVEETGVPGENHPPAASHWQTLSHNVVSSTPRLSGIRTHNFSDCIGSLKSDYHTVTTTTPSVYSNVSILSNNILHVYLYLKRLLEHVYLFVMIYYVARVVTLTKPIVEFHWLIICFRSVRLSP